MKHMVEHQFKAHRENREMLRDLRDYYVSIGLNGKLGYIKALIEFIESYAEIKGWDLDKKE